MIWFSFGNADDFSSAYLESDYGAPCFFFLVRVISCGHGYLIRLDADWPFGLAPHANPLCGIKSPSRRREMTPAGGLPFWR